MNGQIKLCTGCTLALFVLSSAEWAIGPLSPYTLAFWGILLGFVFLPSLRKHFPTPNDQLAFGILFFLSIASIPLIESHDEVFLHDFDRIQTGMTLSEVDTVMCGRRAWYDESVTKIDKGIVHYSLGEVSFNLEAGVVDFAEGRVVSKHIQSD
jgi:hypothetical protein